MVVITYTWRHCADLTTGSPGPPGFLIVCFHPTQTLPLQTEPGLRLSSATALRHPITDQRPPLPLSQQPPNASGPQRGPSPLPYPSSIFTSGNRQESPRVRNLSFRMIFKEGGKDACVLMEPLWPKQIICRCALTSHTLINLSGCCP